MAPRSSRTDTPDTARRRASGLLRAARGATRTTTPRRLSGPEHAGRDHDASLDSATYSCSCGYVFAADVNTTVACPHCGERQAW